MQNPLEWSRLKVVMCFLLPLVFLSLSGCSTKDREAGQALGQVGSKTAITLGDYYGSLADDVEGQAELETFYDKIQTHPLPVPEVKDIENWEDLALALHHREQMAKNLGSLYKALSELSTYDAPAKINTSIDGLFTSLNQISSETPKKIFGVDAQTVLKPAIDSFVRYKQSRSIRRAAKDTIPVLNAIQKLIQDESSEYDLIPARRFKLLTGKNSPEDKEPQTIGVADYFIQKHSMSLNFLLKQIPELQGLPWNPAAVEDNKIKDAMKISLEMRTGRLRSSSKKAPTQLAMSLEALAAEHDKLLKKEPLTLATVLSYQEQAQSYIDLLKKLRDRKEDKS